MLHGDPREELLYRRLAAGLASLGAGTQHLDPDHIAQYAAGELPQEQALQATAHLGACDDGRCAAMLRQEAAGLELARRELHGVPVEPPSRFDALPRGPRSFQCRDALWEEFEGMAREEGCSVDDLINEAMERHLRGLGVVESGRLLAAATGNAALVVDPSAAGPVLPPPPAPPVPPVPVRTAAPAPPPPPPPRARTAPPPPPRMRPAPPPPPAAPSWSPPAPSGPARPPEPPPAWSPPAPAGAVPLFVSYRGERVPVSRDRFVIGRSKQTSDLAIKDPNISRQHALIELVGGRYYIVDLGSTNGIVFQGEPVSRKMIQEGDRFLLGEHEIVFSYRT